MHPITHLERLRTREHHCTVEIIRRLVELDHSSAYLDRGYGSLWDFLVRHLHYSKAAASRRLKAVRCVQVCPQALDMLSTQRTNLSCLAKVATVLQEAASGASLPEPAEVLAAIDGKNQDEVDRYVASLRPEKRPVERVRRRFVGGEESSAAERSLREKRGVAGRSGGGGSSVAELFSSPRAEASDGSAASSATEPPTSTAVDTASLEERVQFSFSVDPQTFEDLQRVQAILSRKLGPGVTLEAALGELVRFYLGKKGAGAKHETKSNTPERAAKRSVRATSAQTPTARNESGPPTRTRHIPAALRRAVHERDGDRCTYTAPDGRRCTNTHDLQIDHIVPFALGGEHTLGNLRLLCGRHNRWRAERTFGRKETGESGPRPVTGKRLPAAFRRGLAQKPRKRPEPAGS